MNSVTNTVSRGAKYASYFHSIVQFKKSIVRMELFVFKTLTRKNVFTANIFTVVAIGRLQIVSN